MHHHGEKALMCLRNNIAALRGAKGWSRPQLAKAAGTSTQQIERLEKAQRRLSDVWLCRLSKALEVQPYELIAPAGVGLPSEEELAEMLLNAQQELPAGLPYSEWPRAVASGLRTRLGLLQDDRSNGHGRDGPAEESLGEGDQPRPPTRPAERA